MPDPRPLYVERNPVIVAAREAFLAGAPWMDDGTVDAAVGCMAYQVMADNPNEPVIGCIDAVVAMRSAPAGDLTTGQLEARVRLDLRLQSDKDREKKRVPSSQAELERRSGRPVATADRSSREALLILGLKEALITIEMLADDDLRREAAPLAVECAGKLRKLVADR
jgi:hypothetical protein